MDPPRTNAGLPAGAVWGSMLGCCLWAFLLTGLFLVKGHPREALAVGVPCILLGLGVGALTVLVASLALRVHGHGPRWQRTFFGTLAFQMGWLLLLGTAWIVPSIESVALLEDAGSIAVIGAPIGISALLLFAGVVMLLAELRSAMAEG